MAANGGKNSPKQISQQVDELNKKLGVTQRNLEEINQTLTVTQAQSQKATQRIGKNLKDINATLVSLQKEARAADARLARMVITGDAIRKSLVNGMTQSSTAMTTAAVSADRMNAHLHKTNMTTQDVVMNARRMTTAFQYAFALNPITMFLRKMIEVRGEFEMQSVALRAIMQNKDEADQLFNQITQLAVKSPFRVKDLLTYTKQLAAYRIENDQLYDTTKRLADVSAGLGVDMGRLILAYGQVKTANFLRASEVRQFTEAGVNMYGELARYFTELEGKAVSTADVVERVSKRMVKFEDVAEVFRRMTNEGGIFYDMQEKQSYTVQGQIGKLKDSIDLMLNDIGTANQSLIKDAVTGITETLKNWHEVWLYIKDVAIQLGLLKVAQTAYNIVLGKTTGLRVVDNVVQQGQIMGIKRESVEREKWRDIMNVGVIARRKDIAALEQQISAEDRAILIDQQRRANIQALLKEEQRQLLAVNGITEAHERYVAEAMNVMTADQRLAVAQNDLTVNRVRYADALRRAKDGEIQTWSKQKSVMEEQMQANEQQIYSINNEIKGHELAKSNLEKKIIEEKKHIRSLNSSIAGYTRSKNAQMLETKETEHSTAVKRLHELETKRDAQATIIDAKNKEIDNLVTQNNSIQEEINTKQTQANTLAKRMQTVAVNGLKRAYMGLRAVMGGAIFGVAVAGLTALIHHLTEAKRKAEEFQKALNEIEVDSDKETSRLVSLYTRMAAKIKDMSLPYKETQEALESLNREFENILPKEYLEIEYIRKTADVTKDATDAIKEYTAQKELAKKTEAINDKYATILSDDAKSIAQGIANRSGEVLDDSLKFLKDRADDITPIIQGVIDDINEGQVDVDNANEEIIKRVSAAFMLTEGQSKTLFGLLNGGSTIFKGRFDKLISDIKGKISETQGLVFRGNTRIDEETKESYDTYNQYIKRWNDAWNDSQSNVTDVAKKGRAELEKIASELNLDIDWDNELNKAGYEETIRNMFMVSLQNWLIKSLSAVKQRIKDMFGLGDEGSNGSTDEVQKQIENEEKKRDAAQKKLDDKTRSAVNRSIDGWKTSHAEYVKVLGSNISAFSMSTEQTWSEYVKGIKAIQSTAKQTIKEYEALTDKGVKAARKGEYEMAKAQLSLADSLLGADSSSSQSGRSKNLSSEISLMKELNSEYNKLLKNYDAEAAKLKVIASYTDAVATEFKDINKKYKTNFSISDIDFTSNEGMVESLNKLEAVAKKMGDDVYAALKKAISPFQAEIDVKTIISNRDKFKKEMDNLIDDYNKSNEARGLGLSSNMAANVFGVKNTDIATMRQKLEEYANKYLRNKQGAFNGEEGKKEYEKWLEKINDMEDKAVQERMKKYVKYLNQSYTEVAAARVKLMQSFIDIDNLDVEDNIKQQMKAGAKRESDEAVGKAMWNEFKDSGMYVELFNNLENASNRAIDAMIARLQGLGEQMKHLDPTQLKAIYEQIEKLEKVKMERGSLAALFDYASQAREMRGRGRTEDVVDTELASAREQELQYQQQITNYQILAKAAEQGQFEEMAKQLGIEQEIEAACKAGAVSNEQITQYYTEQANAAQANLQNTKTQVSELQKEKNIFNNLRKSNKQFASDWKNVTNTVKGSFNDIMDNLDIFGGEVDNESKAFKEVGNAILDVIAIIPTYVAGMTAAGVAINSAMGIIGLIAEAISLTMGLIKALSGMNDAKEQDKIDSLAKSVKQLERDFEDLEKAMNRAMSVGDYASNYDKALANIDERIQKTRQMADAERAKKDTDEEKLDEYADNVKDLEEEREKLKQQLIEDWGGVGRDNWRSMAEDFVSAWMDAFEETGDGLEGLEKKFDEWLKNWFQKQATMKVASAMLEPLFTMIDEMTSKEQGLGLDANEMEQIRQKAAEIFPQLNESLKEMWESFNMGGGAVDSLTGLQQGIEGITEATAEVIEGYLNSIRYFIAEDNAILTQIRDSIVGGVNGSGITTYLQNIVTILNRIDSKIPDLNNANISGAVQGLNVRIIPD